MTVDRGSLTSIGVLPEQSLDGHYRARFPIPPALGRRMSFQGNSLDIGDAGWDPDFPATAQLSEEMYRSATGRTVDGTLAIDPYAISGLLKITGPVEVAPYGTFTGEDFFPKLNLIVNSQTGGNPTWGKKALGPVAQAVMERVLTASVSLWPRMLASIAEEARGGHILFHRTGNAASLASVARDDGSLANPPQGEDYVMAVDANVGGTKSDTYVQKAMQEKVEVFAGGLARHELIASYRYPPGIPDPTLPKGGDAAYRDYVRFYLPETSTVTSFYATDTEGNRVGALEDLTVEHGKRVAGTFFRLPPGQSLELHLVYQAPLAPGREYRLYVQKQAGVLARKLDLLVSYPGGIRKRELAGSSDEEVTLTW
jgi:hypothetical protein